MNATAATPDQLLATIAGLEARLAALESRPADRPSKTLHFLLMLLAVAFGAIVAAALADRFLGISTPYLSDFLNLVGLNGGVGTARNVTADHIMPAMTAWKTSAPAAAQEPPKTAAF